MHPPFGTPRSALCHRSQPDRRQSQPAVERGVVNEISTGFFSRAYLVDNPFVPSVKVQIEKLLLVETLAATPTGPLRGSIPLLFILAWCEDIS